MPERNPHGKCETHTAAALTLPPRIEKEDPVQVVLGKLFDLAKEGNVSAAKLWLDIALKRPSDDPEALTAEQALALLVAARDEG